jgi:hypothetical protein
LNAKTDLWGIFKTSMPKSTKQGFSVLAFATSIIKYTTVLPMELYQTGILSTHQSHMINFQASPQGLWTKRSAWLCKSNHMIAFTVSGIIFVTVALTLVWFVP